MGTPGAWGAVLTAVACGSTEAQTRLSTCFQLFYRFPCENWGSVEEGRSSLATSLSAAPRLGSATAVALTLAPRTVQ